MKQKEGSALLPIIIIIALIGIVGYLVYQNIQLKNGDVNPLSTITNTATGLPNPSLTPDPTINWKTYTDTKFGYLFKYPARYEVEKPMFEALPEGEVGFNAGSKEDRFWIDAVSFSGTLDQFVGKYTAYDPVPKVVMINLNVSSPLGELVNQNNSSVRIYKYTNHYDQSINPGAKDIVTYTGFVVSNHFGYILRSANISDNLVEFSQILSTFKFTN